MQNRRNAYRQIRTQRQMGTVEIIEAHSEQCHSWKKTRLTLNYLMYLRKYFEEHNLIQQYGNLTWDSS